MIRETIARERDLVKSQIDRIAPLANQLAQEDVEARTGYARVACTLLLVASGFARALGYDLPTFLGMAAGAYVKAAPDPCLGPAAPAPNMPSPGRPQ